MKIAYISCFTAPEPSLSEYSLCFADILEQVEEIELVKLDLSAWQLKSGKKMYKDVKCIVEDFLEKEDTFECFHFELVDHHLMVWAALLTKHELSLKGKVFITMHDPPMPVNGSLGLFLPAGRLSHYLARLADVLFPRVIFKNLTKLVDGVFLLTKAGEKSFLKAWSSTTMKTCVIPHVPFKIPDQLRHELSANQAGEKSTNDLIEVFFAGLWWKHKGIEELIQAVNLLANEGVKIRLVMSGTGPASYTKKIKQRLAKLSAAGVQIDTPGHLGLEDLYRRGHQADCWVIPYQKTNKVSASGILTRAKSAEACIIISDLPQFKELLIDSEMLFYETGNADSLAKQIKRSFDKTINHEVRSALKKSNKKEISQNALGSVIIDFYKLT